VQRTILWPEGDERTRVQFLLELAAREGLDEWVVFPTDDAVSGMIARNHASLSKRFQLTGPPWDVLEMLCNKRRLSQLASEIGVDQPKTFFPRSKEDLGDLKCQFPVIVKPTIREALNPLTVDKAWPASDRDSLVAHYERARSFVPAESIMIQELIPGWGETQFSYAAVCDQGHPVASIVAHRARQCPMDFGKFSTYVETIADPGVTEPAEKLLRAIGYSGLAEVEFKRDPRDGGFKLLDVNTRVWGWHSIGAKAGVDFPYLLWRLVQGESIRQVQAREGVKWIRLSGDVLVVLKEILKGRLSLATYIKSLRGPIEPAIFAVDDLLPGIVDVPWMLSLLGRRFLRNWFESQ
jgi:predicted ATP-grasp superfamily ATP-dependent carboligase